MADPSKRTAKDDSDSESKTQNPRPTRAAASQKTPRSKQTVRTEKASDAGTPGVSHILILYYLISTSPRRILCKKALSTTSTGHDFRPMRTSSLLFDEELTY